MSSLHPFYRIGDQLTEAVHVHNKVSKKEARERAIEMLKKVGIPSPEKRIDDYPHQFSGGMRQRVMIGMALINSPSLLIADEPTTALDVTVQAQIKELIMELQQEYNTAVILITHDLGIVADTADQVAVMYGARVVERGSIDDTFYQPEMPYTLGLLASVPRLNQVRAERLDPIPGNPPSPIRLPAGCVFHPRCVYSDRVAGDLCATTRPDLLPTAPGHFVRCHMDADQRREASVAALRLLREDTA
jgi:peptide/nickel transport system ATP-binding protein